MYYLLIKHVSAGDEVREHEHRERARQLSVEGSRLASDEGRRRGVPVGLSSALHHTDASAGSLHGARAALRLATVRLAFCFGCFPALVDFVFFFSFWLSTFLNYTFPNKDRFQLTDYF